MSEILTGAESDVVTDECPIASTVHWGQTVLFYDNEGVKPQLAVVCADREESPWDGRVPLAILVTNQRLLRDQRAKPVLIYSNNSYYHRDSPHRNEIEDSAFWDWRKEDPTTKLAILETRLAALEKVRRGRPAKESSFA